jgi:hypothetical protein
MEGKVRIVAIAILTFGRTKETEGSKTVFGSAQIVFPASTLFVVEDKLIKKKLEKNWWNGYHLLFFSFKELLFPKQSEHHHPYRRQVYA